MPMSVIGDHKGSFRKINPQLLQMVTSLNVICQSLNRAPDHWWMMGSKNKSSEIQQALGNDDTKDEEGMDDGEEEAQMIDLQRDDDDDDDDSYDNKGLEEDDYDEGNESV